MPAYLVGGDYVKTFNDDKNIGTIEVSVKLEQPANLYVLWCKRVPVRRKPEPADLRNRRQFIQLARRRYETIRPSDTDALDVGLVVVIRESEGTAADVPEHVPADLPGDTPVRLRIEQLSSVDHAVACGMPALDDAGGAVLVGALGQI
jgi:hypothetical protein